MTRQPPAGSEPTSSRELGILFGMLLLPWAVVPTSGGTGLVFAWGLFNPQTLQVTTITDYLFVYTTGLPDYLLAWPVGVVLYVTGLLSALGGAILGREDRRVTGGLLVFAGVSELAFVIGTARPAGVTAIPVGTAVLWAVAWWFYAADLRRSVLPE